MRVATEVNPNDVRRCIRQGGDVSAAILNLGCITQDWQVPTNTGPLSVVLEYRDPVAYLINPGFLGAIVGRVANRIGHARFRQNGREVRLVANEGSNMLHGGPGRLSTKMWDMEPDDARAVVLRHASPDGDQGFHDAVNHSAFPSILVSPEDPYFQRLRITITPEGA